MPSTAEVARNFATPPPQYSLTFTWGWNGAMTEEAISRDLDHMLVRGVHAATIEAGNNMPAPYLSSGHMEAIRTAVEQARKRNMCLWLIDEGKYPSGFAAGKFTSDRPDLRMQGLFVADRVPVNGGETLTRTLAPEILGAIAVNQADRSNQLIDVRSGKLKWIAPEGNWEVLLVRHDFRTAPTRSVNNPNTGAKDTSASLMDYLNSAATQQFIDWTHEQYKKYVGADFGTTVLGFRGDEPEFTFTPWTPNMPDEFQKRKGYDVRPYLASFADLRTVRLTEEERRAYADYCDVWSDLFRDNFFNREAKWCADNGLEYQVHIDHEEVLPQLSRSDGDFFKCMRNVQVPGIDTIWHQIWMDNPADFPKLASSAAHLFGHPRSMCEAFAAYQPRPDVKQAGWILNHLLVRGVNRFEIMFWPSSAGGGRGGARAGGRGNAAGSSASNSPSAGAGTSGPVVGRGGVPGGFIGDPGFPALAAYVNRASYLLGEGRPAAQIGLYIPSSSFWLGDALANSNLLGVARQLLEHQRDFDFVDEQALSTVLKLEGSELKNLSGQSYRAIIVPQCAAISKGAIDRLKTFAAAGGKVIFLGHEPLMVVEKTFLKASGPPDIGWAVHKSSVELTQHVLDMLPKPDLSLDQTCPSIKYNHRRWGDADVYFIFNDGDQKQSRQATFDGRGEVQVWDANTGRIEKATNATSTGGSVRLLLELGAWETRCIVIGATAGS